MGKSTKYAIEYEPTINATGKSTIGKQPLAFRKAARDLGCDESEEAFAEALRKIARHKPAKPSQDEPKRKKD